MTLRAGVDFLQLDARNAPSRNLTGWLTDRLRDAVAERKLVPGDRLPPTRELARDLGISRGVVVEAYRRLGEEGMVASRTRGGTVVTSPAGVPSEPGAERMTTSDSPSRASGGPGDVDRRETLDDEAGPQLGPGGFFGPAARSIDIDLAPTLPDLASFPRATWLRHERSVLQSASTAELGYVDARGCLRLRRQLATRLARVRGVRTSPDNVVIVSGAAQALSVLWVVLGAMGCRRIAVEDPGSRGIRDQMRAWGMIGIPIAADRNGMRTSELCETGADVALLTPAHQFPLGSVLAADRRKTLLEWAAAGGLIIEDDYDAEMRYDRAPVGALQGHLPEAVVHLGSVSKALAPGLRLGWMVVPDRLRDRVIETKYSFDIGTATPPQLVLAAMMESADYDRHLRRQRSRHQQRRDALAAELAAMIPEGEISGIQAGLHMVVTLPDRPVGADDAVARRCAQRGVRVHSLALHRWSPGVPGLVLGYGANGPGALRRGVRVIADALDSL